MKIYVEKLPKSCKYCPMNAYGIEKNYCSLYSINNIGQYIDCWNSKRHKKCPLVNIKAHDRELVKEVCEKIREFCENNKYRCNKYFLLYSIGLNVKLLNKNKEGQKETFYEFLDQIEQEFKDE